MSHQGEKQGQEDTREEEGGRQSCVGWLPAFQLEQLFPSQLPETPTVHSKLTTLLDV